MPVPNADPSTVPYDAVVSLGANCETAYQLRRLGLRRFAGPFDWFVTYSVPRLAEQIASGFPRFMALDDLVHKRRLQTTYEIQDTYNRCVSYHDFPLGSETDGWRALYPAFRTKLERRTVRFRRLLEAGKRLLFVRTCTSCEDAELLRDALDRTAAGTLELLIVNREGTVEATGGRSSDRIRYAVVRKGADSRGDDASWDRIMADVTLAD